MAAERCSSHNIEMCEENMHSNPYYNTSVLILFSVLVISELVILIRYNNLLGTTSKCILLLTIFICADQIYENYLAYSDYNNWIDNFIWFDTTDQISRELTAMILNIITLRLY